MTIRLRLTLLYSGILGLVLLLFGALLYNILHFYIYKELEHSLKEQTADLQENVNYKFRINSTGWSLSIKLDDFDTLQSGMYLQLINFTSGEIAKSINLNGVDLPFSTEGHDPNKGYFVTANIHNSPFYIYNDSLIINGTEVGILQAAYNISVISLFFSILKLVLVVLSVFVVSIASYLGWLVSKRALKPIYSLIRETELIQNSDDLARRIHYDNKHDEVGLLSKTMNGMLERIQMMYAVLDGSYITQRRFVADASHELRTPLTTINGNAEFLKKIWGTYLHNPSLIELKEIEISVEAIHDITDEAMKMGKLVNDLLILARTDAGLQIVRTEIELKPIVEAVVRKLQLIPKLIEWKMENLEMLDNLQVMGDKDYLQQLIFIILDNAFKFTENGLVELRVFKLADRVGLMIRDTGIGMDPNEIPHIFERFYRADSSRGITPGTGLGLSIAKWILDEHQGTVEVVSEKGIGTSISIYLPILNPESNKLD
ncbi:sensor histidine kinase [Paenibacillus psychroresistens]|uniref:histidine kinase n=1 Tax=Paenibacillus psychroresistens TaxID=1778678 RepID=A0A6B8RJ54_9BACL|nr:HAMP domain-containing sensor histidine kinase [Paenibacillus psychroresistens]QGQ96491.1 sensor histidine kinase [Paenibacillus psychroresistens]